MAESYLGEIRIFAGDYAPAGWAICDGRLLDVTSYHDLFTLLGTTYGGDGSTNFAIPDLRGRVPVHAGQGPGLSPYTRGQKGGVEHVELRSPEMPPHNHILYGSTAAATSTDPTGKVVAETVAPDEHTPALAIYTQDAATDPLSPQAIGVGGASRPHGNRPPYVVLSYIIALSGVYPSQDD
jgi:microcystin-dependent protein